MNPREMESLKIEIRAVLQSAKHGMSIRRFMADYKELNGFPLPFRRYGYNTVEDLLKSIRDTVTFKTQNGETLITYTQSDDTAHIEKMVRSQKAPKKKPARVTAPKPLAPNRRQANGPMRRATPAPRLMPRTSRNQSFQPQPPKPRPSNDKAWQTQSSTTGASVANQTPTKQSSQLNSSPAPANKQFDQISRTLNTTANITETSKRPLASSPIVQPQTNATFVEKQFSHYNSTLIPERTVIFENQNEASRGIPLSNTVATRPDMKITRRTTPPAMTTRYSVSTESRPSTPSSSYKTILIDHLQNTEMPTPEFRSLGYIDKISKRTQYLGYVQVGEQKWYSHPASCSSPDDAEDEAARKAYEQLKSKPSLPTSFSSEDKLFTDVTNILAEDRFNLMYHNGIEDKYLERFKQRLPSNWLQIIESSNRFEVDRKKFSNKELITVGLVNESKRRRSTPNTPTISPQVAPDDKVQSNDFSLPEDLIKVEQRMPESLLLPGTETWDVVVTRVISASEVIMRLVDNVNDYVDLVDAMHADYSREPKPVNEVIVGKLYAAKYEETTLRVHVQKVENDDITCVFVDEGGEEKLHIRVLHELHAKYLELPFQAFACQLNDLKHFSHSVKGKEYLEDLIANVEDGALVAIPTSRDEPISVILYDTSNPDDRDLNEEILQYLKMYYYDDIVNNVGFTSDVCVTEVNSTGDLYVQIDDKMYCMYWAASVPLGTICSHKEMKIPTMEKLNDVDAPPDVYAIYEDQWYRARINNVESADKIEVFYPDYGNFSQVKISDLRLVDPSLDPLHTIPYLAIKCRLHNVPKEADLKWCQKTTEEFCKIIDGTGLVIMKVIQRATNDSPPLIELFMKDSKNPISLNIKLAGLKDAFDKIDIVPEKTRSDSLPDIMKPRVAPVKNGFTASTPTTSTTNNSSTRRANAFGNGSTINGEAEDLHLNRLSISGEEYMVGSNEAIPEAILPPINAKPKLPHEFYDVFVTLAAHPHNFTIQSYVNVQEGAEFCNLNNEITNFYEAEENKTELNPYMIKEGQFLCVKWTDNYWYRVKVETVVSRDPFSALCYFVDFGDIHAVSIENIQPLFSQFRKVPMQAIKASLSNVAPIKGDWDVVACHEFAKMVENKPFVASVQGIVYSDNKPVLQLEMCDTSGEKDFYIHEILIAKKYAKLISN